MMYTTGEGRERRREREGRERRREERKGVIGKLEREGEKERERWICQPTTHDQLHMIRSYFSLFPGTLA